MQRYIRLDVCDYTNKPLCNLYDNTQDLSGQATDVFVHTERNGYKELTFKLPSTYMSEEGEERNYRLDFLVSDYRIRLRTEKREMVNGVVVEDETETDWYLISESRVTHSAFSTDYEIQAKHISQLLNTKNLDLEFSDDEGNNTGTIGEIAQTILEGTGWHLGVVAQFFEEDKYLKTGEQVEKVRSFTASAKTGAFKMMNDLCELFDAKPVYHGEGEYIEDDLVMTGRTVDIMPINPFSEKIEAGVIPEEVSDGSVPVYELYYDKNIKNVTRTLNTENLVTKLYAYGSYGDRLGMASLQKAEHAVLTFGRLNAGNYHFVFNLSNYYFTINNTVTGLQWSDLDFMSRSYAYVSASSYYKVYRDPQMNGEQYLVYTDITPSEIKYVKNELPYVMDFSYYNSIGLLTNNMFEALVSHQINQPQLHIAAEEASNALINVKSELMRTASAGGGFALLDVESASISSFDDSNGYLRLTLSSDKIVYRSDYDEAKRNYFTWGTTAAIKTNGQPVSGKGTCVYIIRPGSVEWTKAYVKVLGNGTNNYYRDDLSNIYELHNTIEVSELPVSGQEGYIYVDTSNNKQYAWNGKEFKEIRASEYAYGLNEFAEPTTITLWTQDGSAWQSGDKVFLFSSDSIAGLFGPREDSIRANQQAIEESTKIVTETHPITFVYDSSYPDVTSCLQSYGWTYMTSRNATAFGSLYFCWGARGDLAWQTVYVSDTSEDKEDTTASYPYYYSIRTKELYKRNSSNKYERIGETTNDKKLVQHFAVVVDGCINQDVLMSGYSATYTYNGTSKAPGNYAFKNEFNNYWLFTTDTAASKLQFVYENRVVVPDDSNELVIKPVEYSFKDLDFAKENELVGVVFGYGSYEDETFLPTGEQEISGNVYVHENTAYEWGGFNTSSAQADKPFVVCLTSKNKVLSVEYSSPFTTPNNTSHVRIVAPLGKTDNRYLRAQNYAQYCFSKNKKYEILSCTPAGNRTGMAYLLDKFLSLANDAYLNKLPVLQEAQNAITTAEKALSDTLEDMYREGYWQESKYVEGDENKLYIDALDNLKEISHPEASYDIGFLDLYGSDNNIGAEIEYEWPDIEITYAAHLIDPSIDINRWGYIDKVNKCYDQPWKTTIEVNTRLSMIGQQSFTDVLARIAEVANELKAKQTLYQRAGILTGSGKLAAERLEGFIQASKLYILGGTSNWYTDDKGNIVFEATDGSSAMMLTGRGWMVASTRDEYGDWKWRSIATGKGISADAIYTGFLSAERIEAGSITTDKLSSSLGEELDISSNVALNLFATLDGSRPFRNLVTEHPRESDAWIAIGAQQGDNPAYIAIKSGGIVNIEAGGSLNIQSQGTLTLDAADQLIIGDETFGIVMDRLANSITTTLSDKLNNYYTKQETASQITTTMSTALGNYYTKAETASQITTTLSTTLGNYYTKSETASAIRTTMSTALGNYYTKEETASQISTTVSTAMGDYYTKEETASQIRTTVSTAMGDYYTKEETASQITTTLSNKLNNYYTKQETASYVSTTMSTKLGDYYTKQETASQITTTLSNKLNNYYTKTETASYVTTTLSTKLGDYYTKEETASQITTTLSNKLGNYYTKTETAEQISTTMSTKLGDYYTKSETASQITTTLSNKLNNYYTKSETAEQVTTTMSTALGNYYTKSETASEITTTLSNKLDSYYTKSETAEQISTTMSTKLGNYYTKEETASQITTTLSTKLGDYYTKEETASQISTTMSTKLGNYYTKSETASQITSTLSTKLGDYYTKSETASQINTTMSTKLGNYYTKEETASQITTTLSTKLGDYYTKAQTASKITETMSDALSNYYTKEQTASKIAETMSDSLGNYYTKEETASEISITLSTSLGNYYTKSETASEISTTLSTELGNYYTKTETASRITTTLSIALNNYYTRTETASEINTIMANELGNYYNRTETASYVASVMTSKNSTYIQLTDPSVDHDLVVGDWWCKADLATWRQLGELSWRDIQERDIGDSMGGETFVWDGDEWVPRSNLGEEIRNRTMITQTQSYVSLLAESVSTFENGLEVLQGEIEVTSSSVSAEVRRLIADKYSMVSGIYITASGIDISGSQYVKIASGGYFQVATGDFGINTQTASDTDYVMWSGAATASTASFRLKKNGELYITKLYSVGENGAVSQVNFGTNLWKLNYHVIKSVNGNTINLSNGTSINFKTASSLSIQPDGAGKVVIYDSSAGANITGSAKSVSAGYNSDGTPSYSNGFTSVPVKVVLGTGQNVSSTNILISDSSGKGLAYDAGYDAAIASFTHLGTQELFYIDGQGGSYKSAGTHNWYYL